MTNDPLYQYILLHIPRKSGDDPTPMLMLSARGKPEPAKIARQRLGRALVSVGRYLSESRPGSPERLPRSDGRHDRHENGPEHATP